MWLIERAGCQRLVVAVGREYLQLPLAWKSDAQRFHPVCGCGAQFPGRLVVIGVADDADRAVERIGRALPGVAAILYRLAQAVRLCGYGGQVVRFAAGRERCAQ